MADSPVHGLSDGGAVAASDEFYITRSPYTVGDDFKITGTEIAATAPVQSVFGRTGAVVAATNDYSFAQLSGKPTTLTGYGITSPLPLAQGGTAADLSGTGGASFFLRQNSAGAAITVVQPAFTDLSGVATNAQGGIGKVTLTQPATGSTLTIADGKTLTVSNTLTLTATDGSSLAIGTGGTLGTAAFQNTGTSGATLPFLNGTNTFAGAQTFTTNVSFSAAATNAIALTNAAGGIRFRTNADTTINAPANSTYRFGQADAASPVAQSVVVQNVVAGNTNVAGATFTIQGSLSNGSGGGDILIKTTLSTAASGTQNTAATAMTFQGGTQDCIGGGFLGSAGFVRVTTQFDKTADTALANITGLSVNVAASGTYQFRAVLFVTSDAVGGQKYAMAGTATATAIIYEVQTISNSANTIVISSKQTALGGSVGQAGSTDDFTTIEGLITVNAAGTLTVQFAQNAASGTSSVLVGSHMLVHKVA